MTSGLEPRYHPAAADEIKDLEPRIKSRIKISIERLQDHPLEGKPLSGELHGFRSQRVGDYRIIYNIKSDRKLLYILYVGHRKSVYQEAKRKLS